MPNILHFSAYLHRFQTLLPAKNVPLRQYVLRIQILCMCTCSYQPELFLFSESVDVRIDLPSGTSSPVGYHEEIHTPAGGDVHKPAGVVCHQCLYGNKDASPAI